MKQMKKNNKIISSMMNASSIKLNNALIMLYKDMKACNSEMLLKKDFTI